MRQMRTSSSRTLSSLDDLFVSARQVDSLVIGAVELRCLRYGIMRSVSAEAYSALSGLFRPLVSGFMGVVEISRDGEADTDVVVVVTDMPHSA
jgi:hypothetical protein